MSDIFLDTAFAIALASPGDAFHTPAVTLSQRLAAEHRRMVTTSAVVFEIGNALARQRYRSAGVQLVNSLRDDPSVEIVGLAEATFRAAVQLYSSRSDKEWGLTDCLSFVLMQERGITQALTCDEHFEQAGFMALLLHPTNF